MLYELIATVRPRSIAEVKDIAKTAGNLVLSNNGVIRGFTNWGVFALPKPVPNKSGTTISNTTPISSSERNPLQPQPPSPPSSTASLTQNRTPKHTVGHYFIMRFDASARTQHLLRKTWNADPRLLRFSVVKLGEKLEDICDVGGRAEEWKGVFGAEGSIRGMGGEERESRDMREEWEAATGGLSEVGASGRRDEGAPAAPRRPLGGLRYAR